MDRPHPSMASMHGQATGETPSVQGRRVPAVRRLVRPAVSRLAGVLLVRLLGAADVRVVGDLALRELELTLRSRHWSRFTGMWLAVTSAGVLVPLLYRSDSGHWLWPSGAGWFCLYGYMLQVGVMIATAQWSIRRFQREIYSHRLDELVLTRSTTSDIAMSEGVAAAVASLWLVAATLPLIVFSCAIAGLGARAAILLCLSILPGAALGVWFGMGWGLAFATGRRASLFPLTDWWLRIPFLPVWLFWAMLGAFPVIWALLSFVPGGLLAVNRFAVLVRWLLQQAFWHLNPILTVAAIPGGLRTTWWSDWLILVFLTLFMMRKSMDAIQEALVTLPEQEFSYTPGDAWVHHDVHHFMQYGEERRRQPGYRDGGNPITAFDVALGHRVYLHPVF